MTRHHLDSRPTVNRRPGTTSLAQLRPPRPLPLLLALTAVVACAERKPHPYFQAQASSRPFLVAHRGGGGIMPEETLPTLLAAQARDPAAIVEFDVFRSRDGHLVVNHDATVDRTTNGRGRIADMTLAELQSLDAGFCASPGKGDGTAPAAECQASADPAIFPFRGMGHRIATLDEVLAAMPPQTFLSIEVKAPGFERQFADTMRAWGRLDHLATGSEDDDVAVRIKDLLPEAAHFFPVAAGTCLALTSKLGLDYQGCPQYDLFASPLSGAGLALDTRGVLDAAHGRGAVVIYWTINDAPTMERLFKLGADGIFTDYPDVGRQVVDRLRAEGALP